MMSQISSDKWSMCIYGETRGSRPIRLVRDSMSSWQRQIVLEQLANQLSYKYRDLQMRCLVDRRAGVLYLRHRQTDALNREAPSLTRMLKPRKPKLSATQLFYSAKKPHQLLVKLIAVQSSALFAKEQPTCICNIQRSLLRFTVKRLRKNCPRKVESDNWSVC